MPNQRSKTKVRFGGFVNRKLYRQILACAAMEGMAADKFGFMQVLIREGMAEATAGRGRLKVKSGRKKK